MLARFLESHTVYLVCGYTDMRKSIDGLSSIVALPSSLRGEKHGAVLKNIAGREYILFRY